MTTPTDEQWAAATDELFEALEGGYGITHQHAKGLAFRMLVAALAVPMTDDESDCAHLGLQLYLSKDHKRKWWLCDTCGGRFSVVRALRGAPPREGTPNE